MRSFISLTETTADDVTSIVERAVKLGGGPARDTTLRERSVGVYFRRTSTRTRTAFTMAAARLGADVIAFGPSDLQLNTGESVPDTARVLGGYLDILVVRTNDEMAEMRAFADADGAPAVVNALTDDEHPTQAMADLATVREEFGTLAGLHLLYVGEGNSTARALVYATALTPGLALTVVTPPGYGLPDDVYERAARLGGGADRITGSHAIEDVREADAVYTSRWQQMGVSKADPAWLDAFTPYQVTDGLLDRVGHSRTVFLHDLPAVRGQEVTDEVLDGARSRAWRQAFHKMTAAMAVLEWCAAEL
jgi:ornithine carbamoyltransferase